jgi:hypothetical protein
MNEMNKKQKTDIGQPFISTNKLHTQFLFNLRMLRIENRKTIYFFHTLLPGQDSGYKGTVH